MPTVREKPAIRMFRVLKHFPNYSLLLTENFLTQEAAEFCAAGIALADHLACSILETVCVIEYRKERDVTHQHQTTLRLPAGSESE